MCDTFYVTSYVILWQVFLSVEGDEYLRCIFDTSSYAYTEVFSFFLAIFELYKISFQDLQFKAKWHIVSTQL